MAINEKQGENTEIDEAWKFDAPKQLSGKIALVTCSSFGISRGIALELAARGASVIGRSATEIKHAIQKTRTLGDNLWAI